MNEETLQFGRSQHLVGTITRPARHDLPGRPRVAALLTNAGVISRIGPRGINVKIARRLAEAGIPCMRWDLSGLGDSARAAPSGPDEPFVLDTLDAMKKATELFGVDTFVMIGFCSGADVAFHTALRDQRLKGLLLFDHYLFPTRRSSLRWWRRRAKTLGVRLLPTLAKGLGRRLGALASRLGQRKDLAAAPSAPRFASARAYAERIQELTGRGVQILFVYSGTFIHVFNYPEQHADLYRSYDFSGRTQSLYLPNADHVITSASEQGRLLEAIVSWVTTTWGTKPAGK